MRPKWILFENRVGKQVTRKNYKIPLLLNFLSWLKIFDTSHTAENS